MAFLAASIAAAKASSARIFGGSSVINLPVTSLKLSLSLSSVSTAFVIGLISSTPSSRALSASLRSCREIPAVLSELGNSIPFKLNTLRAPLEEADSILNIILEAFDAISSRLSLGILGP